MGGKLKQREDTVYLSIALLDKVFTERILYTTKKNLNLCLLTCFLIASKYDELDENIPLIRDL